MSWWMKSVDTCRCLGAEALRVNWATGVATHITLSVVRALIPLFSDLGDPTAFFSEMKYSDICSSLSASIKHGLEKTTGSSISSSFAFLIFLLSIWVWARFFWLLYLLLMAVKSTSSASLSWTIDIWMMESSAFKCSICESFYSSSGDSAIFSLFVHLTLHSTGPSSTGADLGRARGAGSCSTGIGFLCRTSLGCMLSWSTELLFRMMSVLNFNCSFWVSL